MIAHLFIKMFIKFALLFSASCITMGLAMPKESPLGVYREDAGADDFSDSGEATTKALWFKSFKDLKKAAFGGRQLEAVIHLDYCRTLGEEELTPKATIIQRFQIWQWLNQYPSVYNGEVLVLPTHTGNRNGDVSNEEFIVMGNNTVLWAVASVDTQQRLLYTCQMGTGIFFRAPDQARKTVKTASDAIKTILTGNYNEVVAVVDYSQCNQVGDTDGAPLKAANGGLLQDHLIIETYPSGPLQMNSAWSYMTKFAKNATAEAGLDFQLKQDNTVVIDAFKVADGYAPTDYKFNCTYSKGVQYYF